MLPEPATDHRPQAPGPEASYPHLQAWAPLWPWPHWLPFGLGLLVPPAPLAVLWLLVLPMCPQDLL